MLVQVRTGNAPYDVLVSTGNARAPGRLVMAAGKTCHPPSTSRGSALGIFVRRNHRRLVVYIVSRAARLDSLRPCTMPAPLVTPPAACIRSDFEHPVTAVRSIPLTWIEGLKAGSRK